MVLISEEAIAPVPVQNQYPPDVVPPDIFATTTRPENDPGCFRTKAYPPHRTCEYVVRELVAGTNIPSMYALAQILELPFPHMIYAWLNGTRRISPFYMSRMMKLWALHSHGIALFRVQTINWVTGEIIYKKPRGKNAKGPGAGAADRGDLPPTKIRAKS